MKLAGAACLVGQKIRNLVSSILERRPPPPQAASKKRDNPKPQGRNGQMCDLVLAAFKKEDNPTTKTQGKMG